jgi:hypothetical protein
MEIPQELIDAMNVAQWGILALPGVTGLSIGLREQDGELLDEIAFRVMVDDLSQVPEGLPETLAGVNICLVEGGVQPAALPDRTRYTNVGGGIKLGTAVGDGTLGVVVKDAATSTLFGLTCFHVVDSPSSSALGDAGVWQPDAPMFIAGQAPSEVDKLGQVKRLEFPRTPPLPFATERVSNVDAAIFSLDTALARGRSATPRVVGNNGDPSVLIPHVKDIARPDPGKFVRKRGFQTGERTGIIVGGNATCPWPPGGDKTFLVEQYEIRGSAQNPDGRFCTSGDSGSLVILDGTQTAIGLLYGASPSGRTAIANVIDNVQSQLGVQLVF